MPGGSRESLSGSGSSEYLLSFVFHCCGCFLLNDQTIRAVHRVLGGQGNQGLGLRVYGCPRPLGLWFDGFGVQGLGFRVWGSGFGV